MRLIDVKKLEEYKADCCVSLTEWMEGWNAAIDTIMSETLTVDAEPVRYGYWVEEPDRYFHWHCSECGYVISGPHREFNYCPKCGTKMHGDRRMTNAERIREMTDEELVELVCNHACILCPIEGCEGRMEEGQKKCKQYWLDWLK